MAAYCRVSTLEQKKKGYGIDIQKREIEHYCQNSGIVITAWYIEEARSGFHQDRQSLTKLLRDCRNNKVSGIVVSSLDRLRET